MYMRVSTGINAREYYVPTDYDAKNTMHSTLLIYAWNY